VLLRRLALSVVLTVAAVGRLGAADQPILRPTDLVGDDAALMVEIRRPKAAWDELQEDELFRRLRSSDPYRRWLQSDEYRKWTELERIVTETTGASLAMQVLDLCAREAALAVYLANPHRPEGVLLTRAEDAATVERVLQNWHRLEPQSVRQTLKHQGQAYVRRAQVGGRKSPLYYVTFGDVFALSDHESRIKQVIELRNSLASHGAKSSPRLRDGETYQRILADASRPEPVARLFLPANAWTKTLEDASPSDQGAAFLRRFWPAVEALSIEVRLEEGVHLAGTLKLKEDRTDERWRAWSAPTPSPDEFLATIPANAVLVASGGLHLAPLWQFIRELASREDQAGWEKPRRVLKGILGGRDALDDLLPALVHQAGLYLVFQRDKVHEVPFDGVLVCHLPQGDQTAGLHVALDQALSAGLTLLSVHANDKHPDSDPAIVHSSLRDGEMLRWLETSLPIRVAYHISPRRLAVSRSIDTLKTYLASDGSQREENAFRQYRRKWFPDAGQFLCVDVRLLRDQMPAAFSGLLARTTSLNGSDAEINWPRELIRLCDAAYVATRFEPDGAKIRLGVTAEPRR
jgi:hypothetical protein